MAKKTQTTKNTSAEVKARVEMALGTPRITEKATMLAEKNAYVFDVAPTASKTEIKKAIETLYGKVPVKVAITRIPRKTVYRRGKVGHKNGGKKAIVYLAQGDKIEIA